MISLLSATSRKVSGPLVGQTVASMRGTRAEDSTGTHRKTVDLCQCEPGCRNISPSEIEPHGLLGIMG